MGLSHQDFLKTWKEAGEDTSDSGLDTAWRRYEQVRAPDHQTILEDNEPDLTELESTLSPLLQESSLAPFVSSYKFVSLPSDTIPWMATGVYLKAGDVVSTFATGRIWRAKILDLFVPPKFALHFRVGVNGRTFNSTRDTNTVMAPTDGELYLASQFPGLFGSPEGGRLQAGLSAYDPGWKDKGSYQILIVVWKEDTTIDHITNILSSAMDGDNKGDKYGLINNELDRLTSDHHSHRSPQDWTNFWFIGDNEIYTQENLDGQNGIRCCPEHNVGILQKHYDPAVPFDKDMLVTWDWCFTALPSRLREDTAISHDYLSLAFEFENGRDITYTWSWELPPEFGYWCPFPTWEDREYHVVIRSGTADLGKWLSEKRDLYADYVKYINDGDGTRNVPCQIVRVWLIAANVLQRHKGEMLIKKIVMGDVTVL